MALPVAAMPLQGFAGGLIIGLAAVLFLIGNGRVAGVSGLAARIAGLSGAGAPRLIAAAFVAGLPMGALAMAGWWSPAAPRFPASGWIILLGGLLVGFGTRLGSGCTSGHGVCGVSRLSRRSLAATAVFMAVGAATVAAMNRLGAAW